MTRIARPSIQSLVSTGIMYHQNGDLAAAASNYRAVLAREPYHADALHLLGMAEGKSDLDAGIKLIERAIACSPKISMYHSNLGSLQSKQGDAERAEHSYRRALALDAHNTDVFVNLGNLLHASGRLSEARTYFQSAIDLSPELAEAHISMGCLEAQEGNWTTALKCYAEGIRIRPEFPAAYVMLANAYTALNRLSDAESSLRRALALNPGFSDAHFNLGSLYRTLGRLPEAAACYQAVIFAEPLQAADAWNMLGLVCSQQEQHENAVMAFHQALKGNPDHIDYLLSLSKELALLGDDDAAITSLSKILVIDPKHAGAHFLLGSSLQSLGNLPEAIGSYRRAISIEPKRSAEAWNNLGVALGRLKQTAEAFDAYAHAIENDPNYGAPWCNLGALKELQGMHEEALLLYQRAIELSGSAVARRNMASLLTSLDKPEGLEQLDVLAREQPLSTDVQWARGLGFLMHGRYLEGWKGFECRSQIELRSEEPRIFPEPRWQGEPLEGRTILLYSEQGFGDTLQFCRYVPLVAQRGGKVVLDVQSPLRKLLQSVPGVSVCLSSAEQAIAPFDLQCPLMSLPFLFSTTLESIPPAIAPTCNPPARPKIDPANRLRVGLVWAGDSRHRRDAVRSIPLEQWKCLAGTEGVAFTSLQRGPGESQIQEYEACFNFVEDCSHVQDFADTSELLHRLDLVITVDTAVAHLAGTLGVPVWILLDRTPDWRWGLKGNKTPWYPNATLFRQGSAQASWEAVMQDVASALRTLASSG